MKAATAEWIEKAEGDFQTALREMRVRRFPNYDAVCFHAQQCAEKYLKARMQEAGLAFRKTHDLAELLDGLVKVEPLWEAMRAALETLTTLAVDVRYPGETADRDVAKSAMEICKEVRQTVRKSLRLRNGK